MDTKKLEALIKKGEKKRNAQLKKVKAAEAKVAAENEVLAAIDEELKPLYDLRKKYKKFEKDFNATVAEFATDDKKPEAEEKPAEEDIVDKDEDEEKPAEQTTITYWQH